MVYEVKCSNCGDVLDFGGREPEDSFSEGSKIPEDAIEFDDEVYCRSCVQELIEFGGKDFLERLEELEREVNDKLG
ncbi:MAG: hypothetical protein ABEK04_05885 [Candidatus Nanohalobium sp.]